MSFPYRGFMLNLLDTPGHADFSEDTYRTLSAADNALMLVDAGKGLEPQTRKLFEVCRMNGLPVFTFINKMDRPALAPLELLDQIEKEFGLATYPVNWPIGSGDRFRGVYHRPTRQLCLFTKVASGSREATVVVMAADDPKAKELMDADLYQQARAACKQHRVLMLSVWECDASPLRRWWRTLSCLKSWAANLIWRHARMRDAAMFVSLTLLPALQAVWAGQLTPVFFGSAANNFGVQLFLDTFLSYAAKPRVMSLADAAAPQVTPTDPHFTGFVFKLQANMDPRHRDKVAFVRVVSGEFRRGMKVQLARTGRTVALTRPQKMFGQEREVTDFAYAGDIIGLNNPGAFAIGDTLFTGPRRQFPLIPSFSPELFATLRNPNTGKYKQFNKGVAELLGEGAVQCLYSLDAFRSAEPILAAVGQLQFEVVQERMRVEYGVETVLDPLPYTVARWVTDGWPAVERAGRIFNALTLKDVWGRPVLLFRNQWNVDTALAEQPEVGALSPIGLPPTAAEMAAAAAQR